MVYKMDDVTKKDADTIGKWAADPRFFYVYINSGIPEDQPDKAKSAGAKYATMCDLGLQGRKADLSVSEQEGGNIASKVLNKGLSEISGLFVKAASPWDKVHAKGLRNDKDELIGLTVLLHEKATGKTEIGYMLDPDYHGKGGLGTRMVMSALAWARANQDETGLTVLKADVDPSNGASCGILKKLGLEETEYKAVGDYKNRDGSAIPSQILEGAGEKVDQAVQAYLDSGKKLFKVRDAILDARSRGAPGVNIGNNLDASAYEQS